MGAAPNGEAAPLEPKGDAAGAAPAANGLLLLGALLGAKGLLLLGLLLVAVALALLLAAGAAAAGWSSSPSPNSVLYLSRMSAAFPSSSFRSLCTRRLTW
jgi:hypothetical protein